MRDFGEGQSLDANNLTSAVYLSPVYCTDPTTIKWWLVYVCSIWSQNKLRFLALYGWNASAFHCTGSCKRKFSCIWKEPLLITHNIQSKCELQIQYRHLKLFSSGHNYKYVGIAPINYGKAVPRYKLKYAVKGLNEKIKVSDLQIQKKKDKEGCCQCQKRRLTI